MADGHCGEVDVSPDSIAALREIFQEVLDAFACKGTKRYPPKI